MPTSFEQTNETSPFAGWKQVPLRGSKNTGPSRIQWASQLKQQTQLLPGLCLFKRAIRSSEQSYTPEFSTGAVQPSRPQLAPQNNAVCSAAEYLFDGVTHCTDRRDYTRITFTDESKPWNDCWQRVRGAEEIESQVSEHHPISFRLVWGLF